MEETTAREKMIAGNRDEYGDNYAKMTFVDHARAAAATDERRMLLAALAGRVTESCQGTKLNTGQLSPGCALCRDGVWSCLFINNLCNGSCFYCPTEQKKKAEPMTNTLTFPNPKEFTAYLDRFGFKGASISGGEPLLTLDRTLSYLKSVKQKFGDSIHLWMYTNGILFTEEKGKMLRDAGLDEIRFDISAAGYRLDRAEIAARIIPTVTVEIPAIPEDYGLLSDLLPELSRAGVKHLNLHQMRATPHNIGNLLARGYTFVHGPLVTVLESELTALRILNDALDGRPSPAVNYCSFPYKHRFQARAARARAAGALVAPWEDITPAGYIRSLAITGESAALDLVAARLAALPGEARWKREGGGRLCFAGSLWPELAEYGLPLSASYFLPRLRNAVSYAGSYKKIPLGPKREIVAERRAVSALRELAGDSRWAFALYFIEKIGGDAPPELEEIAAFERLETGLIEYF